MVVGNSGDEDSATEDDSSGEDEDESMEDEEDGEEGEKEEGMIVEDGKCGKYDCPNFILTKNEEVRIHKPWRKGVIVKLLGRKIGFKALENRLHQMWVRKGVLHIIDLGRDYCLVTFSHKDNLVKALLEGPWLIFDHYLVVKKWCPDFDPATAAIEKVSVWLRFSELPIEYYDYDVLKFIGDRIGRTVKVDKNTLTQERGKYAKLCVEVDLTKPLLAMFTIKGRQFKVEYEGLHLLCLTCGKFGHYQEGCLDMGTAVPEQGDDTVGFGGENGRRQGVEGREGPWIVVQKSRRPRQREMPPGVLRLLGLRRSRGGKFRNLGDPDLLCLMKIFLIWRRI